MLAAGLALGACVMFGPGAPASSGHTPRAGVANPLAGWVLYRYHNTPAAFEAARFRARRDFRYAALMQRIADQPIATWLTKNSRNVRSEVAHLTTAASRTGAVAQLVTYDIPGQGCATGPTDRGAASSADYLRWISEIARGIGPRRTIVILEPDALPFSIVGCPIALAALREAVELLDGAAGARVYVDAGNASWIKPTARLAQALRTAGIARAAGFSLNVSNFQTDATSIAYGESVARQLGGAHFVIDTSRNGNGPDRNLADEPRWCNPPGRALGRPPTTDTGVSGLDAYLWIKPPGASDDACRAGDPPGGHWWPHYALELAANAAR